MNSTAQNYVRGIELVSRNNSRLLIVDVQEKLVPAIAESGRVVSNCRRLAKGAGVLGVPVFITEQYPKGLGPTVPELLEFGPERLTKTRFSCAEVLDWGYAGEVADDRHQVVIAGIEAHVCVLQTALDLIASGFQVFVVADAVASRNAFDFDIALRRLSGAGATIVTTESVLFEWCEVAGTPEFKQISALVKSGS